MKTRITIALVLAAFTVGCVAKEEPPAQQPTPPEPPLPAKPGDPLPPKLAEAEKVGNEIVDNSKKVRDSLAAMQKRVATFETDRHSWEKLDRTIPSFREANKALWEMNRDLLALYDLECQKPLGALRQQLKDAPKKYLVAGGVYYDEAQKHQGDLRENYLTMSRVAFGLAEKCELRYREYFDAPTSPDRVNAVNLEATIATLRQYERVHAGWETLCRIYPMELTDGKLAELFGKLGEYGQHMTEFKGLAGRFAETVKVENLSVTPKVEEKK